MRGVRGKRRSRRRLTGLRSEESLFLLGIRVHLRMRLLKGGAMRWIIIVTL